jgi:dihydrofolate synthase/folylpolyglutamate synthase
MQINGQRISEEQVVECMPEIYGLCERNNIPATFFRNYDSLGVFLLSRGRCCCIGNLFTGLGGRLDATNVIRAPALSIITSIGLEHTRILGDTIELIALEKGGIMRKFDQFLVGPHCPQSSITGMCQGEGCQSVLHM